MIKIFPKLSLTLPSTILAKIYFTLNKNLTTHYFDGR